MSRKLFSTVATLIFAFGAFNFSIFAAAQTPAQSGSSDNQVVASELQQNLEASVEAGISPVALSNLLLVEYATPEAKEVGRKIVALELDESEDALENATVDGGRDTDIIALEEGQDVAEVVSELEATDTGGVLKRVQPVYNYRPLYAPTNDPDWSQQWYFQNSQAGLNLESAWSSIGAQEGVNCGASGGERCGGDPDVKIAVIDTGVNINTSDLSGANIDRAGAMRFYNNSDNTCAPGTYYVGFQQNPGSNPPVVNFCQDTGSQFDEQGHGTGVASIIFAQDNVTGTVGAAYNTTLLPIAVHGAAFNTYFIAEAVTYAADNGADIINLSLGSPFYDSYLEDVIDDVVAQGVIVVAASGNCAEWTPNCDWDGNGTQTSGFFAEEDNAVMYPAGFDSVVAVGSSTNVSTGGSIERAYYSNFGPHLDVVAPVGDGGESPTGNLVLCGVERANCPTVNTYKSGFGTSYASPQIAGVAGLVKSQDASLNTGSFRELLSTYARDLGPTGRDDEFGVGLPQPASMLSQSAVEVRITSPAADGIFEVGEDISIQIDASTTIGSISNVELYDGNTLVGSDTTVPYTIPLRDLQEKRYDLRAVATTAEGISVGSRIVDIYAKSERYSTTVPAQPSGDFNGNGRGDILWANDPAREVAYWDGGRQNQGGYLGPTSSSWDYLGKGDFDNNGREDIVWIHKGNLEVHYWLDGRQGRGGKLGIQTPDWTYLGTGDMDNNGREDIVWWHKSNQEVGVWFDGIQANGRTTNLQSYDWFPVGIGDVDGNGTDDILWWHRRVDEVGYWGGGLQTVGGIIGTQDKSWTPVAIGDVNGNGRIDMIWVDPGTSGNVVQIWDGARSSVQLPSGTLAASNYIDNVSDLDGDGRDDLIVRTPEAAEVWYRGQQARRAFLNVQSGDWRML